MAQVDQFETYLLQLINNERAKVGAAALAFDPELVNAAERHSTRMDDFNFFAHKDPVDGSSVSTRATDASGRPKRLAAAMSPVSARSVSAAAIARSSSAK